MVKQAQTLNPRRMSTRTLGLMGLPVVIAVLFSVALVQSWVAATNELDFTKAEQRGVAYLQPLTDLLDRMVEAQSATVEGNTADATRLREGMRGVDSADREHGKSLGSGQRWAELRDRIDQLINKRPTGEGAYRSYTEVIQLLLDLARKVADTSKLVLDPVLDSYYLMDASVLKLPNVTLFAGRANDLARLSVEGTSPFDNAQSETSIAVARYQVALDSEEIASGLRKAMDATESETLGPNITNQLDTFRTAVDGFVPPLTLQNLDKADPTTLSKSAVEVRTSSRKLTAAVLGELDRLLQERADNLAFQRMKSAAIALLMFLLTALLLMVVISGAGFSIGAKARRLLYGARGRSGTGGSPNGDATDKPGGPAKGGPPDGQAAHGAGRQAGPVTEELAHVGRGTRTRRRERADDAR